MDATLLQGMNGEQRRPIADAYWQAAMPDQRMGTHAETFTAFDERVTAFVPQLQQLPDGAVLFGHGMWIGLLVWKLLGFSASGSLGMKAFRRFQLGLPMPNGAVYHVRQALHGQWYAQADEAIMRALSAVKPPESDVNKALARPM